MTIELENYQLIPVNFLKNHRGVILVHSTGSGKTITALYGAYQFPNDIIIVGPKSSRKTFQDNVTKAKMDPDRFTFFTYTKIKKIVEENITIFKNASVIIDEAHNLRNENIYNMYIISALQFAFRIVLLTATPVVNYMNDLSPLVNIIKGTDVLPTDRHLFDQMFYDEDTMRIINKDIFVEKIKDTISYYKKVDNKDYPSSTVHKMPVVMSHEQIEEYIYYVRMIFGETNYTDREHLLDINYALIPKKKKNSFLNVTRQLSNTVNKTLPSPKILDIFEYLKKGPYPIIVYSNFLGSGIYLLVTFLEKQKIRYKSISGFTSSDKIKLIVDNYNIGSYQVLLLTSAGSESLDLKNTRQIHIMEPHWHESRIDQVVGRTIRYKSHATLPKKERHVDIYRWISVFPKGIQNQSADEYLLDLSLKKRELWDQFEKLIMESSIERNP